MIYQTLYKRAKTGKILSYNIRVEDNETPQIIKETGQLDGAKTTHKEIVPTGKQKRTPFEQAISQSLSDWKKKRDEGYKSLDDLGISDIKELDENLPEFNTDSSGSLKPMKAPTKAWDKSKKLDFPQLIEPKMDGLRSTLVIKGDKSNWDVTFLSSGGKIYHALKHLISEIKSNYQGPEIILDGELYCHGMNLPDINSAVKRETPDTLKIKFHIFDMPKYDAPQSERTDMVKGIVKEFNNEYYPELDNRLVYTNDEILTCHNQWVDEGYEGAMIKRPNGRYQPGQRSSHWIKVKMFDDDEFKVIGYKLGLRGVQDLIFICECEGGTFDVQMNGSIESKQELYDKIDSLITQDLTCKFFGYTPYGIPNLAKGKAFRERE